MTGPGWLRVNLDVLEQHGADAAVVLALISYRSEPTGSWTAEKSTITEEARLTRHRAEASLSRLRGAGLIDSDRADRFHPTLSWWATNTPVTRTGIPGSPVTPDSRVCSLEDVEEQLPPRMPPASEQGMLPLLAAVPALPGPSVVVASTCSSDDQPEPGDERWWEFWWEHYPRKVGKKAARAAWDKAVKAKVHPLVMLRGLADQRAALSARLAYCPHPATWLNGQRWEDTVEHVSPADLRAWRGNPFARASNEVAPVAGGGVFRVAR